jgi:tryptophanyl-tRNA synthetase
LARRFSRGILRARRRKTRRRTAAMPERRKISLTGIKPTGAKADAEAGGSVHVGNYFGAIRPALRLCESYDSRYFIADYHALTTQREPDALRDNVHDIAACWLACGLDPKRTLLFRQSDVVEVFELMWICACVIATGQLERGHAYKDALAQGIAPNAGIFNYPLLMAADILLYDTDVVPIGSDNVQHLEVARDIAVRLNHLFGEGTVVVPQAVVSEGPIVPGSDGRKMSKSYGNAVPLFAPSKALEKAIMGFKSDSAPLEAPKEPEGASVYELYKLVASPERAQEMAAKLRAGGYGWGHAKRALFEELDPLLAPLRARYLELRRDDALIEHILEQGGADARAIAQSTMARVRKAIGIR